MQGAEGRRTMCRFAELFGLVSGNCGHPNLTVDILVALIACAVLVEIPSLLPRRGKR
jgi:hypothetical protein